AFSVACNPGHAAIWLRSERLVNGGLRMGWSRLSRRFMPRGFFSVLLCSFILAGQAEAQEVIVARETKPEAPKQAAPPPEQTPSESPTPDRTKAKSPGKEIQSAGPNVQEMRKAGGVARHAPDH